MAGHVAVDTQGKGCGPVKASTLHAARQSIAFFSLLVSRRRMIVESPAGALPTALVAERPVALPPKQTRGACPRSSTNITNTHEIASGGPPGLRPKSSASNSWISPMIGRKPQRRLRACRFRANPTHTLRLHPGLRLSHLLRLQTRARRHRLEARGLAVPFWPLALASR
jgi:hypothetical protein